MKRFSFLFLPVALLGAGLGCNTALVTEPAVIDAGPPCPTKAPVINCDAGTVNAVVPGTCTGGVTLTLNYPDASATVAPGTYPLGCSLGYFVNDPASPDCIRAPSCTCVAADAGVAATDDGGAPVDAGPPGPGVWSCFAQ